MYLHGIGNIYNFLKRSLHEILGLSSAIILIMLFCKVNMLLVLDELPQKLFHTSL
jgi:hypothetical protein